MKANEVRRGNWVKTCTPNMEIMIPCYEARVQGITVLGELQFNHTPSIEGFKMAPQHVAGIPLSHEWIERTQFRKENFKLEATSQDNYAVSMCWGTKLLDKVQKDEWRVIQIIKYVHEWQNLYFALVNDELEIIITDLPIEQEKVVQETQKEVERHEPNKCSGCGFRGPYCECGSMDGGIWGGGRR